jgi:hypothetical protein
MTFIAATSAFDSAVVAVPTGADGDILCAITFDCTAAPAGFVQRGSTVILDPGVSNIDMRVWTKVRAGDSGNFTFTGGGFGFPNIHLLDLRGVSAIPVMSSGSGGTGAPTAPSVSPAAPATLVFNAAIFGVTATGTPTGMTLRLQTATDYQTWSSEVAAGATGSRALNTVAVPWTAFLLAFEVPTSLATAARSQSRSGATSTYATPSSAAVRSQARSAASSDTAVQLSAPSAVRSLARAAAVAVLAAGVSSAARSQARSGASADVAVAVSVGADSGLSGDNLAVATPQHAATRSLARSSATVATPLGAAAAVRSIASSRASADSSGSISAPTAARSLATSGAPSGVASEAPAAARGQGRSGSFADAASAAPVAARALAFSGAPRDEQAAGVAPARSQARSGVSLAARRRAPRLPVLSQRAGLRRSSAAQSRRPVRCVRSPPAGQTKSSPPARRPPGAATPPQPRRPKPRAARRSTVARWPEAAQAPIRLSRPRRQRSPARWQRLARHLWCRGRPLFPSVAWPALAQARSSVEPSRRRPRVVLLRDPAHPRWPARARRLPVGRHPQAGRRWPRWPWWCRQRARRPEVELQSSWPRRHPAPSARRFRRAPRSLYLSEQ